MKTTFNYRIYGNLIGFIWMPNTECFKEFDVKASRIQQPFKTYFESLRDLLLTVSNDGDFQSCSLNECYIDISYQTGNKTITKTYDLRQSKDNADLFTEELVYPEYVEE